MSKPSEIRPVTWLLLAVAIAVVCQSGCVRRRMTIRTNPPGAQVFIDDQEVGVTPVSTRFTYYGTRNIRLVKDGFETLTVKQTFNPPWYELPVLEFVSETLWPFEKRDERLVNFDLQPQRITPPEQLLERAGNLRLSSMQGAAAALPFTEPLPATPLAPAEPIFAPPATPTNPTTVPPPNF